MGGTLDQLMGDVRQQLHLDAETEHEVLEEIRFHLAEAAAAAVAQGTAQEDALAAVTARFGAKDVGQQLQDVHAGWGTAEGVIAAALPVACALALRWLVFSPDGVIGGWHHALFSPAFWVVSLAALVVPALRLPRWRHALASWAFFWVLSIATMLAPGPGS